MKGSAMNRSEFFKLALRAAAGGIAIAQAPGLLAGSALAEASEAGAPPKRSSRKSKAPPVEPASNDLLVSIFLRGGSDGLNFVTPIAGPDREIYESARPSIKIAASGDHGLLKLDERFGLHPGAKAFHDLYGAGNLAIVHAAGLTADTRSHFDAQNFTELGTPKSKSTSSGWLARHLRGRGLGTKSFEAVAIGGLAPISLLDFDEAVVINALGGFNLGGNGKLRPDEEAALAGLYVETGGSGDWIEAFGREALEALGRVESALGPQQPGGHNDGPEVTGDYPKGEIGNRLKTLAQLMKMGMGIKAATVDMGGWDTHKFQGKGSEGHFAQQVQQLSQAVSAFYGEMQKDGREVTVLIQTEFGRRVKENANQGTDHGHGGVMFVLGEHVAGGKVYGEWPGLKTESLYEHADLAVANDYRQVVSEILVRRFGERHLPAVFPGYTGYKPLGLIRS
jgi:uncharacterized protein (DUF1501 family)